MKTRQETVTIRFSEMKDAAALMELDELVWDRNTAPEPLKWSSRDHYLLQCPPGTQLVALHEGSCAVTSASGRPQGLTAIAMCSS